jgi:uncharacterized protein (TIGR03435 family)
MERPLRQLGMAAAGVLLWWPAINAAQTGEHSGSARFDTASVRVASGGGRRSMALTPDGLTYTNVTVMDCLTAAFGLDHYQVVGPDWITRDRFMIAARTGTPSAPAHAMLMLQSLLVERFDLTLRREKRDLPVYALRVGPDGPRLRTVEERGGVVPAPGGMTFQGMTMAELTREFLSHLPSLDRPVIDETGLEGRFQFTLRVFDPGAAPADLKPAVLAGGPELFIHALEQVGLTLARERRSAEVLIVDRARRIPEERREGVPADRVEN